MADKWITQLVAEHRQELVLEPIRLPQFFGTLRDALLERLVELAQLLLGVPPLGDLVDQGAVRRGSILTLAVQLANTATFDRRICGLTGLWR